MQRTAVSCARDAILLVAFMAVVSRLAAAAARLELAEK